MKDTVSHYVPPHSPLTSTEPQVFSNNLTMPGERTLDVAALDVGDADRELGQALPQGAECVSTKGAHTLGWKGGQRSCAG